MTEAFLNLASLWGTLHWSLQLLLLAALFIGAALAIESPAPRWHGLALLGATGLACALCMSAGRVAFLHASWAMLAVAAGMVLVAHFMQLPLMGILVLLAVFVAGAGSVGALFNDAASELLGVSPTAAQLALVLLSTLLIAPCAIWSLTHRGAAPPPEPAAE